MCLGQMPWQWGGGGGRKVGPRPVRIASQVETRDSDVFGVQAADAIVFGGRREATELGQTMICPGHPHDGPRHVESNVKCRRLRLELSRS